MKYEPCGVEVRVPLIAADLVVQCHLRTGHEGEHTSELTRATVRWWEGDPAPTQRPGYAVSEMEDDDGMG